MHILQAFALLATASQAADGADLGVSETLFNAQGLVEKWSCEYCPTNQAPLTSDSARSMIRAASARGVSVFREIIPLGMLVPHESETARIDSLAAYLAAYRHTNSRILVSLGMPVPAWIGSPHPWCAMVESDSAWDDVSTKLTRVFGRIASRLLAIGGVTPAWIERNLAFEPFNEFDALSTEECTNLTSHTQSSTPERGADLQRKIRAAMEALGVHPEVTAPSITGVHSGTGFANQDSSMAVWMERYYRAGGGGVPNLHVYRRVWNPDAPLSDLLRQFRTTMEIVTKALPDSMQGRILLGETGVSVERDGCTQNTGYTVLPSDTRSVWYKMLATDSSITAKVDRILFWRLRSLPPDHIPQAPCESTYGLVLDGAPLDSSWRLPFLSPDSTPSTQVRTIVRPPEILLRHRHGQPYSVQLSGPQYAPLDLRLFDTNGSLLWSRRITGPEWHVLPSTLPSVSILHSGAHSQILTSLNPRM